MKQIISKSLIFTIFLSIFTVYSFSQNSLRALEFFDPNTGIAAGANGTIFRTTDAGTTWNLITSNVTYDLNKTTFVLGDVVVIVGNQGTILKSIDGGNTFETYTDVNTNLAMHNYNGVSINSNGIGFIVGTDGIILKTTDAGSTWVIFINNLAGDLNAVSLNGTDNGIIVGNGNSITYTTDGGVTWQSPGTALSFAADWNAVKMVDRSTAYATSKTGHIIKTTDYGNSWVLLYQDPEGDAFHRINQTESGAIIAVGNTGQIVMSPDQGLTWVVENSGTSDNLNCFSFLDANTGFAGGESGLLIRTDNGGADWYSVNYLSKKNIVKKTNAATSNVFYNFPNPFNPTTTISYSISFDANVSVKVYDLAGREVAVLVNSFQKAGSYNSLFNASSLSSGVYFYKITAVNGNERIDKTMRMILTK